VLISVIPPSLNWISSTAKLCQLSCVHDNLNPIQAMTPSMKTPMKITSEPIIRTLP
jgi:hypothetical protein